MIFGILGVLIQPLLSVCGLYKIKTALDVVSWDMFFGVGIYGISFLLWLWLLRVYPVSIVFPVATSLNLIATALMGVLVLHESWNYWQGMALILILSGIALLSVGIQKTI
ncbi:MAG: hypothetical protein IJ660_05010 [Alphaproteobacteria bacterium]|jgi:drug/metabolite transporter (DMT)-like permease|nr:hypothetical protein [Alphaproteobacteria bacterium]